MLKDLALLDADSHIGGLTKMRDDIVDQIVLIAFR
jgi:hypothetical protein